MASLSDIKVPRGPPRPCPACSEPPSLPLPYLSVSGWGCIPPRASPQVGPGWGRTWPLRIWVPRPKPRTRGHPAACEGWGRAQWDIPSCLGAPGSLPLRQGIRRLRQRAQCWWLLLAGEGGLRWAGWDPPPRGHLSQSPISYALAVPSVSSFFFCLWLLRQPPRASEAHRLLSGKPHPSGSWATPAGGALSPTTACQTPKEFCVEEAVPRWVLIVTKLQFVTVADSTLPRVGGARLGSWRRGTSEPLGLHLGRA